MGITEGTIHQDFWTLPSDDQGALEQALEIKKRPVILDVVTDIEALAPRP